MAELNKKKLSKNQRRSINHMFVEQVSIPMLILATSVLFTSLSWQREAYSLLQYFTMVFAIFGISLLGFSIFARRAVAIVAPKNVKIPNKVAYCEEWGAASSYISLAAVLATIHIALTIVLAFSTLLGLLLNYEFLKSARHIDAK